MSARVPHTPPSLTSTDVESGKALRSETWAKAGLTVNHIIGRGRCLITAHSPRVAQTTDVTRTLKYWIWPSYAAKFRLWVLRFENTGAVSGNVFVTAGSVSTVAASIPAATSSGGSTDTEEVAILEELSAQSAESEEVELVVLSGSVTALKLHSVALYEVPLNFLSLVADAGGENAIDETSVAAGAPIYHGLERSIGGVWDAAWNAITIARRSSHFAWAVDADADAESTASVSLVDLFLLYAPVTGRKLLPTDTTRKVRCRVYARDTSEIDGTVQFDSQEAGDTLTITLDDSTVFKWYEGSLDVACEDLTDAQGNISATQETVQVRYASPSGATCDVASVCIGEAVPVDGEDSFTGAHNYELPTDVLDGSTTMTRVAMVRVDSAASGVDHFFANYAAGGGWSIQLSTAALRARVYDGTASVKNSATYATTNGETYLCVMVHDGTNFYLYVNGAAAGAGTAITGYSSPDTDAAIGVLRANGGNAAETVTIIGVAGTDTKAMSAAEVADYYALCQSVGTVVPFEECEHLYNVHLGHAMTQDQIGKQDAVAEGSGGTTVATFDPDWG